MLRPESAAIGRNRRRKAEARDGKRLMRLHPTSESTALDFSRTILIVLNRQNRAASIDTGIGAEAAGPETEEQHQRPAQMQSAAAVSV